jgi:hypothetical protein
MVVHPANARDRDGAFHLSVGAQRPALSTSALCRRGYAGTKMVSTLSAPLSGDCTSLKRSDTAGFAVFAKRPIV